MCNKHIITNHNKHVMPYVNVKDSHIPNYVSMQLSNTHRSSYSYMLSYHVTVELGY